MNSENADYLKAGSSALVGDDFNDAPNCKRRWTSIFAHEASTVEITSDKLTVNDGSTLASVESIDIPAGAYYFGFFKRIHRTAGTVTCFRKQGL